MLFVDKYRVNKLEDIFFHKDLYIKYNISYNN